MKAIMITAGIFVAVCVVGYVIGATATSWLMIGVVVASAIWAAVDSSRKRLGAAFPLIVFIGMCLLWFVTFPWYLVTRSNPPAQARKQRRAVALVICAGFVVVIGGALWFMNAGGDVHGIWARADSQLAAADTTVPSKPQTSTAAVVPTSAGNPAPASADVVVFNSIEDLLNGYEEKARGKSVSVTGKINGFTLTDTNVELESPSNEKVICNFASGEREKFGNLDPERDQHFTATLGDRVDLGETPSGRRSYKIDLVGCRLQ
ncbi:MAG TPA: hypothetical protein VN736_14320 [Candidatus Limnocylindrales bacterium]|nr:hypothetical protein [Candidatus Limnocylindrales bacterium]